MNLVNHNFSRLGLNANVELGVLKMGSIRGSKVFAITLECTDVIINGSVDNIWFGLSLQEGSISSGIINNQVEVDGEFILVCDNNHVSFLQLNNLADFEFIGSGVPNLSAAGDLRLVNAMAHGQGVEGAVEQLRGGGWSDVNVSDGFLALTTLLVENGVVGAAAANVVRGCDLIDFAGFANELRPGICHSITTIGIIVNQSILLSID